jgi:cell wall-associated NlpC family hydrolase
MRSSEIDPQAAKDILEEARQWVGTPYRHQGKVRGRAVDCVGLILGVGHNLGLLDIDPAEWREFASYSRTPNPRKMATAMELFLRPLDCPPAEDPGAGAIGWFGWRDEMPMHLAIMGEFDGRRTMIHAFSHAERCVEHGFVSEWPGRVVSWWAYPGTQAAPGAPDDRAGRSERPR